MLSGEETEPFFQFFPIESVNEGQNEQILSFK